MEARVLHKAGAAIVQGDRLLLCQPYAFDDLILPGGIIEPNESVDQALLRELREELGDKIYIDTSQILFVGTFIDQAAARKDTLVQIQCYFVKLSGKPVASDEIKSLVWFSKDDNPALLSPIVRNFIIPALVSQHFLHWEGNNANISK